MSLDDPGPPSKEQLEELIGLPLKERGPELARLLLVPENPSRIAYTVLRQIYLTLVEEYWGRIAEIIEPRTGETYQPVSPMKESLQELMNVQSKMEELQLWLKPPHPPLSLQDALKLAANSQSEFWQRSIMKQIGKRRSPGQPATKRHLALRALDIKCAYPETSLREVTDILCPCGNDAHTTSCREQLRQQILRLVRFLRQYGHDFTWAHLTTRRV